MSELADQTRWMDGLAQAQLLADGDISAEELVTAAIERVEALNEPLNAVVIRWFDEALAAARSGAEAAGSFHGVPTLLKDLNAHEKGRVLTNANVVLRDTQPVSSFDSHVVARLRDSGAVTIGRSSSSEFGSVPVTETAAYGATRNPWDLDRTPGGSSGGAAAAVAAGIVPVAHASDGGGSIRIPASCCGLVGLKPSQGRISMGPDRQESGLAVDFAVTRSVRDTAALLDALSGPAVGDNVIAPPPDRPYIDEVGADPGRLRIGILDTRPGGQSVDAACADATRATAQLLESLGHIVEPAWPESLGDTSFAERFIALWAATRATGIASYGRMAGRELGEDDVEPVNWAMGEMAALLTSADLAESLAAIADFRRRTLGWWNDGWDLLLTPTVAEVPLPIGTLDEATGHPLAAMIRSGEFSPFTPPFNATGQPGISLPMWWNDDDVPIGVQLVADYGRDDLLIQVASQLETAQPWADRCPPVNGLG